MVGLICMPMHTPTGGEATLEMSKGVRWKRPTSIPWARCRPVRLFVFLLAVGLFTPFALLAAKPKTLVYCLEANPSTLSAALAISGTDMNASAHQMFNTLTRTRRGSTDLEPSLAESWTVENGGRTFTFNLRKGVKFHATDSFTPTRNFSADDVLFSFERQWRAEHPFHGVARGRYTHFDILALRDTIRSIEKLDDHTIRFRLSQPNALFPAYVSLAFTAIYSAEYADQLMAAGTPDKIDLEPVGTGPFQLVQFQRDLSIRYKAHTHYWEGKAAIDNLVFVITPDAAIRYHKLKAGECHVMAYPNPADIEALRRDPDIAMKATTNLDVGYLAFNATKKPLSLRAVRQAINLAIDKEAILEAVYLGVAGTSAKTPIPPSLWSHDETIPGYPYDPDAARRLLAEAGYPDGFTATLWTLPVNRPYLPNAGRAAEMIQRDLAEVSIKVEIITYEWGEYIKRARTGEHDMILMGWVASIADPDDLLHSTWSCAAAARGMNPSQRCHPDLDGLLHKGRSTLESSQREKYYREAQALWHADALAVPLAHSIQVTPIRKEVFGYKPSPLGKVSFYGVDLLE